LPDDGSKWVPRYLQTPSGFDGARLNATRQIHFSQIHFSDVLIAVNSVLSFEPNPFTAADAFGLDAPRSGTLMLSRGWGSGQGDSEMA
jgi:hypothetical protein